MIIARTVPHFYPRVTGPGKQAYHISKGMKEHGLSSIIFTTTPERQAVDTEVDLASLDIRRLGVSVRFMQFDVAPSFPRVMLSQEFDILHAHEYREYLGTIGFIAARMKRKPFVLQPHGSLVAYAHTLPKRFWRPYVYYDQATRKTIVRKADAIVVSTAQELREASQFGAPPDRIHVIPPGIVVRAEASKQVTGRLRLLFVGRISASRRVHDIIRAFALAASTASADLTIVGGAERLSFLERPGYYEDLVNLARRLGVADRVKFTGPLHGRLLEEMYNKADVFVHASAFESFGQTLLEAAAHHLPILSTPVGAANDLVVPGETGFLFDVGDTNALAQHIRDIVENQDRIPRMSRRLVEFVRTRYDWTRILSAYRELYERLAAR